MTTANPTGQRTFLGHPLGLYVLFFTEMWERFSYYGMRALLMLYMVNFFKWSQKDASTVYKVYTSFVYVTPIIGGFLADRYLGNRMAVIIGAILMALGQFFLALPGMNIFLIALLLLIVGNGFFKPNMSTQVGRLYPTNDGRRDAAYTIFYMGINLGAFFAPLVCGWLADNTVGGYQSGFVAAGIGMILGLLIYLLGQPLLKEIDPSIHVDSPGGAGEPGAVVARPLSEAEAEKTPSIFGGLSTAIPPLLYLLALVLIVLAPTFWYLGRCDQWDAIMLAIGGVCLGLIAFICGFVHNAVRDRVLAILVLGVFVMFFWGAFEQAGNVLNLWADKNTNRYIWQPMQPPVFPEPILENAAAAEGGPVEISVIERFSSLFKLKQAGPVEQKGTLLDQIAAFFNPLTTTAFQAVNSLAIFLIAPLFAWMWIWLDRRNMQPSIPIKMFLGLVLMSLSVAVMIQSARQEDRLTNQAWTAALPSGIQKLDNGALAFKDEKGRLEPFHAGRLTLADGQFKLMGVLPDTERDRIIEQTAPEWFHKKVEQLGAESKKIKDDVKSASVQLDQVPEGFDMRYSGLKKSEVQWNPATKTLTTFGEIRQRESKGLLVAAGAPEFRQAIGQLYVNSATFRVSSWWLVWSYILATLGELCLSPVGLSMVSKLAPAKFATMLMGVWMLTSAFGNFAAGAAGEIWGTIPPVNFYTWLAVIVAISALVLLVLSRKIVGMMHGVK